MVKNQLVVVYLTGNTAGLLCGVLGTYGYNAKNLRFGYSISWEGSRQADQPINGPIEVKAKPASASSRGG